MILRTRAWLEPVLPKAIKRPVSRGLCAGSLLKMNTGAEKTVMEGGWCTNNYAEGGTQGKNNSSVLPRPQPGTSKRKFSLFLCDRTEQGSQQG